MILRPMPIITTLFTFFFFNDTATTEIYTLSLHDALPISPVDFTNAVIDGSVTVTDTLGGSLGTVSYTEDRKSTRLNSSHQIISYAVFCLKKQNQTPTSPRPSSL